MQWNRYPGCIIFVMMVTHSTTRPHTRLLTSSRPNNIVLERIQSESQRSGRRVQAHTRLPLLNWWHSIGQTCRQTALPSTNPGHNSNRQRKAPLQR